MSKFLVTIVGDLMSGATANDVAEHIMGAADMLIPGLYDWDDVTAESHDGEAATITAVVSGDDVVPAGNPAGYTGQEVNDNFVITYVMGAGDCWLTGYIFSPLSCLAVRRDS